MINRIRHLARMPVQHMVLKYKDIHAFDNYNIMKMLIIIIKINNNYDDADNNNNNNQLTLKCTTPTPLVLNASPDVTTP